jgi:hypothetical protein
MDENEDECTWRMWRQSALVSSLFICVLPVNERKTPTLFAVSQGVVQFLPRYYHEYRVLSSVSITNPPYHWIQPHLLNNNHIYILSAFKHYHTSAILLLLRGLHFAHFCRYLHLHFIYILSLTAHKIWFLFFISSTVYWSFLPPTSKTLDWLINSLTQSGVYYVDSSVSNTPRQSRTA